MDGWMGGEDREQEWQREGWIDPPTHPPPPRARSVQDVRHHQAVNRCGQCVPLRMLLHIIDKSVCVNEGG